MDPAHAALVSEIEQLAGAIDQHRTRMAGGAARGRGAPYRGRGGRGAAPRHRSLTLAQDQQGWVRTQSKGSLSLVHPAVYEQRKRAPPAAPEERVLQPREVVVDGVPFVFDASGTRLLKKSAVADDAALASRVAPTPRQASVDGEAYVRTKNGHLINKALVLRRRAAKETHARTQRLASLGSALSATHHQWRAKERARTLCTYYTRTGQCRRGSQCPFVHDDTKRALCPGALKPAGCILPPATCRLSHTPSAHNVPHCVYYLRDKACRHPDACPYTHADVAPDAPLCDAFATLGWCERGAACTARHARLAARAADDAPRRTSPEPDALFVRDDAAAADERYFGAAQASPAAWAVGAAASPRDFAEQQDYIGLPVDGDVSDVSTDLDSDQDAAEVDAALGP